MIRVFGGGIVWAGLGLCVALPYLSLFAVSFATSDGATLDWTFTLASYARALQDAVVWQVLATTVAMCLAVAAIATGLALPVAVFIAHCDPGRRALWLILVAAPLLLSYVLKIYAFRAILGGKGVLNAALLGAGVITSPLQWFVFSLPAVLLVQTVLFIPFAVFPILIALDRIPASLREAASDLSARPARIFRSIILPLARPGIVSAFAFTFLMALGDFLTPQMVGGPNGFTFSRMIYSQFGLAFNWPFGAVLGLMLAGVAGVILALAFWLGQVRGARAR